MGKYTKITRLTLFTFHGTRHRWLNSLATIFRRSARVKMWKESKRLSFLENDARTIRAMINCVLLFPHAPALWTTPRASTTTALKPTLFKSSMASTIFYYSALIEPACARQSFTSCKWNFRCRFALGWKSKRGWDGRIEIDFQVRRRKSWTAEEFASLLNVSFIM